MTTEEELREQVKMTQEAIEIIKQLRKERDIATKYIAVVAMEFFGDKSDVSFWHNVPGWQKKCSKAINDCYEIAHLISMAKEELLEE